MEKKNGEPTPFDFRICFEYIEVHGDKSQQVKHDHRHLYRFGKISLFDSPAFSLSQSIDCP